MSQKPPFWSRVGSVWLLLAPVCAAIYSLTTTISQNDFWWHVAAARLQLGVPGHPAVNHFAWPVAANAPYIYQNWLAEALMYRVLRLGGLDAIIIWRSAAVALTLAMLSAVAMRRIGRRRGGDREEAGDWDNAARCVALSMFLSLAMIAMNLDARPQTFALPFFALVVAILFDWPQLAARRGSLALALGLLALLTTLWSNFHGSFFLAPFTFIVAWCGEALYAALKGRFGRRAFGRTMSVGELAKFALPAAVCLLATAVNPLGFGLFSYVAKLSANTTVQKYMYEWQPPSLGQPGNLVFFVSPVLLLLVWRIGFRRIGAETGSTGNTESREGWLGARPGEMLLLLALFAMGTRSVRSVLWFALLLAPIFAIAAYSAFVVSAAAAQSADRGQAIPPGGAKWANTAVIIVLLLGIEPFLPRFKASLPWPAAFRARFAPTPRGAFPAGFDGDAGLLLDKGTPVVAAEYLRGSPPMGRLWNDMGCGSYLMWALPDVPVSADPRIEMYPGAYWLGYLRLAAGPPDAAKRLATMGVSDVLLDPEAEPGLIRRLSNSPGWHKIVLKRSYAVLLRRKPFGTERTTTTEPN